MACQQPQQQPEAEPGSGATAASSTARPPAAPQPTAASCVGPAAGAFAASAARAPSGRAPSLRTEGSLDLAVLELASSASADLRFRRAESLLPCGLTADELSELLGRHVAVSGTGSQRKPSLGPVPEEEGPELKTAANGVSAAQHGAVHKARIGGGVEVGVGGFGGTGGREP